MVCGTPGVLRIRQSKATISRDPWQVECLKSSTGNPARRSGPPYGLLVLAFVGLGPAAWQPRSGLSWEIDHFVGYCIITLMCCVAWPRPRVVGGALVIFAGLLEGLQAFMPDRSSYYWAAVYSASGVLVAALIADLFLRVWRQLQSKRGET
jgi:VanZ family protein